MDTDARFPFQYSKNACSGKYTHPSYHGWVGATKRKNKCLFQVLALCFYQKGKMPRVAEQLCRARKCCVQQCECHSSVIQGVTQSSRAQGKFLNNGTRLKATLLPPWGDKSTAQTAVRTGHCMEQVLHSHQKPSQYNQHGMKWELTKQDFPATTQTLSNTGFANL